MLRAKKRPAYALRRRCLRAWARPTVNDFHLGSSGEIVYALANRSLADAALLDIVAERNGLPSPDAPLEAFDEPCRYFFLNRPSGMWRRNTMRAVPERMLRLQAELARREDAQLWLTPVSIFWGRGANKDRSWIRALLSEGWAISSRLRRLLIFLFNRRDILVQFGEPLPWHDIVRSQVRDQAEARQGASDRGPRHTARLLRVKFRNQKVAALGPDLSHRRTLVAQILASSQVTAAISAEAADGRGRSLESKARKAALAIAADMSYPTVLFLDRVLAWFWHRVYEGVSVRGVDGFSSLAQTHTLVYTPCHRSHIDYLLLSYVLYHQGLMLPHIAAGDNLNMPVVGGVLRRGGAFFMRRSFQGDRVYTAVFSEYLYQVFRRGHSVEYFLEGGRTRTGRLLPARLGMLQMTLEAHRRGVPRPIAFVPVYFGYEKLIEAGGYVEELRGASKRRESMRGVLRSLMLVRQSLGSAQVSFGKPLVLDHLLSGAGDGGRGPNSAHSARTLGNDILVAVNAAAVVNATNLVALTTLSMPRQAIDEQALVTQIDLYRDLMRRDADCHDYAVVDVPAEELVSRAERLGWLTREGATRRDGGEDVLRHDRFTSVLMTWYRNNVLHVFAAPAFVACLLVNRRRGIRRSALRRLFHAIFPYVRRELQLGAEDSVDRWLAHLQAAGLIELRGEGMVAPQSPVARFRLRLLANTVMQVVERFYICAALLTLAGVGVLDRRTLLLECRKTAERISTLYGIDAPEFSDARLFEGFLQALTDNGVVAEDEEGKLVFDYRIGDMLRAGRGVIAVELRQALEPADEATAVARRAGR